METLKPLCVRLLIMMTTMMIFTCSDKSVTNFEGTLEDDIELHCKFPNDTYPMGHHKLEWYKKEHKLNESNRYKFRKGGKIEQGDDLYIFCAATHFFTLFARSQDYEIKLFYIEYSLRALQRLRCNTLFSHFLRVLRIMR